MICGHYRLVYCLGTVFLHFDFHTHTFLFFSLLILDHQEEEASKEEEGHQEEESYQEEEASKEKGSQEEEASKEGRSISKVLIFSNNL